MIRRLYPFKAKRRRSVNIKASREHVTHKYYRVKLSGQLFIRSKQMLSSYKHNLHQTPIHNTSH
jgi:hypothetical protein